MNKLENIIAYFCRHYPHQHELSKARLTKLVYLADWFSSLLNGEQLTEIEWVFNHYGPYVDDVENVARKNSDNFTLTQTYTGYGDVKYLISFNDNVAIELDESEERILDFVITRTQDMYFNQFIDYVYSTYPIQAKERYSRLNLQELAREYLETEEQNTVL